MTKLLTSVDADRRTVATLVEHPRASTAARACKLLGGRIVVLWGPDAIREVLDQSADVYDSGSGAKGKGMWHFQPDALTLSHGEEWRDRREFTESVLATSERVHPCADRFVDVVADEVERLRLGSTLDWEDFERLFDRLTLRVIFGDRARGDQELTELLETLMCEANRLVGLEPRRRLLRVLRGARAPAARPRAGQPARPLRRRPADATARGSCTRSRTGCSPCATRSAPTPTGRWRSIVGAARDRARVREELEGADLSDPSAVDGLAYLEGCLQEAMRLWPTTPLLAREATRDTTLAGERDRRGHPGDDAQRRSTTATPSGRPDIDRMKPERWRGSAMRFNHLSGGSQYCPGGPLVLPARQGGPGPAPRPLPACMLREPELPEEGALPNMLDAFAIRFGVEPRDV